MAHRRISFPACLIVAGLAIVTLLAACAASALAGPTATARFTRLGPPPAAKVLRHHGRLMDAGIALYKVGDTGTVPAYSLHAGADPEPGETLDGMDPAAAGVPQLREVTYVAGCSATQNDANKLSRRDAAADQLAIWHLVDGIPLTSRSVADAALRTHARSIARGSYKAAADHRSCLDEAEHPLNKNDLSSAAYAPTISLATDQTPTDEIVVVNIATGSVNQYPTKPQVMEVRINGVPAFICSGQTSTISTTRAENRPVKTRCGQDTGPRQLQYPVKHATPTFVVDRNGNYIGTKNHEPLHGYASATIKLPRTSTNQRVTVIWNSHSVPGVVYVPRDGGAPIITAGAAHPNVDATTVVKPTAFTGFGAVIERWIVASLTNHGIAGIFALGLLIVLLLTAREWLPALARIALRPLSRSHRDQDGSGQQPAVGDEDTPERRAATSDEGAPERQAATSDESAPRPRRRTPVG